jgi:hypothetical protein
MAKKNFNSPAMENLLAGLTNDKQASSSKPVEPAADKVEQQEEAPRATRRAAKSEQLSTSVDVEIMNKVRALMEKEGLNKKEVVTAALIKLLQSYEAVHGELRQKKEKKGKIDVLLDL